MSWFFSRIHSDVAIPISLDFFPPAYTNLMEYIRTKHPKFAYVHFVEDVEVWRGLDKKAEPRSLDHFRSILRKPVEGKQSADGLVYPDPDESSPTVFISCGDYKNDTSVAHCEAKGDLVAIGRSFISK